MRVKVTIRNSKNTDQSVILEFTISGEGDIARYVNAAGDNFRADYPGVPFEDKLISLETI